MQPKECAIGERKRRRPSDGYAGHDENKKSHYQVVSETLKILIAYSVRL
jgi:hypothetical protein